MNNKLKLSLIIIGIIVAIILFNIILFAVAHNKVIFYEEQIKESQSAVRIQEKRRLDLIINLVDSVKSYNKYEQETMKKIVQARQQAKQENIGDVKLLINNIVEQYPNLKSNESYKQVMTEISVTENLIAEYRNNYNSQVKSYLNYTKKFPTNIILNLLRYNTKNYEYLNYEISSSSPKELWK